MSFLRRFGRSQIVALTLTAAGGIALAQVEPPLPGEDGTPPPEEAFSPLLEPGEVPPPESVVPEPSKTTTPSKKSALSSSGRLEQPLLKPSFADLFPELPPASAKDRDIDLESIPGLVLPDGSEDLPPVPGEEVAPPRQERGEEGQPPRRSGGQPIRAKWLRNPREARKLSIEQKKPLLLFFSLGSDQKEFMVNGRPVPNPTRLLIDDLTSQPVFNEFAAEHLILCSLHYQAGKTAPLEEPDRSRFFAMQKIKEHFKASLPSLILLDHKGREIDRVKGYSRVRNAAGKEFSSGMILFERLKSKTLAHADNVRREQERLDRLAAQGYRVWKSRAGTELMAKIYSATPQVITVMDEQGRLRRSRPEQLSLFDREWVRRWRAGLIPPPGSKPKPAAPAVETIAEVPPPLPDASAPAGSLIAAPRPSR